jgi:hypothetical protein
MVRGRISCVVVAAAPACEARSASALVTLCAALVSVVLVNVWLMAVVVSTARKARKRSGDSERR